MTAPTPTPDQGQAVPEPDRSEILRTLALLAEPGQVFELRALDVSSGGGYPHDQSGYFDDYCRLAAYAEPISRVASGVYVVANPVNPVLLARCSNRLRRANWKSLTTDADILRRRWLFLDVDPKRPAGISATDEEHKVAFESADKIRDYLRSLGWPAGVLADSGNGAHPLYRIDLPNDPASAKLIKRVLQALAARFDTPQIEVDTTVSNASRLLKLYGTIARKGENTPERPHRLARLLDVPHDLVIVSKELLEFVASIAPGKRVYPHHRKASVRQKPDGHDAEPIREGERHTRLVSLAGSMLRRGLSEKEIEGELLGANWKQCERPLDQEEVRQLAADVVARYGSGPADTTNEATDDEDTAQVPEISVEPFPLEVLPAPLRQFVQQAATSVSCPVDYIAVPMLAVLGTAIGNRRRLSVKEGWEESACLYTAVVGEPGTAKSPALQIAAEPLRALQETFLNEYREAHRTWRRKHKAQSEEGPHSNTPPGNKGPDEQSSRDTPPVLHQIMTTDTTIEALMTVLDRNPLGIALIRDELTAWMLSMNEYKKGSGADKPHWQSTWGGSAVVVNRKHLPEPIIIPRPFVCVAGCIPPEMLKELSDEQAREDGFIHRILFAFPEPTVLKWNDAGLRQETRARYRQVFDDMQKQPMSLMQGELGSVIEFSEGAKALWVVWLNRHYEELEQGPPHLRGPWSKMVAYCIRLCLILHEARVACGEVSRGNADETSLGRAIRLIGYFKSHAKKVYQELQATPTDRRITKAVTWIKQRPGAQATAREFLTYKVAGCANRDQVVAFFELIEQAGWGHLERRTPQKGGKEQVIFRLDCRTTADATAE